MFSNEESEKNTALISFCISISVGVFDCEHKFYFNLFFFSAFVFLFRLFLCRSLPIDMVFQWDKETFDEDENNVDDVEKKKKSYKCGIKHRYRKYIRLDNRNNCITSQISISFLSLAFIPNIIFFFLVCFLSFAFLVFTVQILCFFYVFFSSFLLLFFLRLEIRFFFAIYFCCSWSGLYLSAFVYEIRFFFFALNAVSSLTLNCWHSGRKWSLIFVSVWVRVQVHACVKSFSINMSSVEMTACKKAAPIDKIDWAQRFQFFWDKDNARRHFNLHTVDH